MKLGRFDDDIVDEKIIRMLSHLTDEQPDRVRQVCEQYEKNIRRYDVYLIDSPSGRKVLKKTEVHEARIYETYLAGRGFPVPRFYGQWEEDGETWILLEYMEGGDLRDMTDALALAAADTLSQIQNAYWTETFGENAQRFETYWQRIQNRLAFVSGNPELKAAYQLFADRQLTCPRTLSHGDLLEFNTIHQGGQVSFIDWECGGIMPYSLDIARFIAHATEDRSTFQFRMTDEQKKLFIDRVYEKLEHKPDYGQYLLDIKLAVLHEYIGFSNGEDDFNRWYQRSAAELARELSRSD